MLALSAAWLFSATVVWAAPASTTTSASSATIQFFNFTTNKYQETFPWNTPNEIVVSGTNISNHRPIKLLFSENGSVIWQGEIANNTQSCKDKNTCSTRGPTLGDPGKVSTEITALDLAGNTIATHKEGQQTETKTTTQNQTQAASSTQVPQGNNWYTWWWMAGFLTGLLWILLWIFVGRQWMKLHFWGFGWPWPWWFWIPVVWFIPWLIIGFWWWLDWWFWWAWIWWLFPWVFWVFWWIVVFKEAMIWMWRGKQ